MTCPRGPEKHWGLVGSAVGSHGSFLSRVTPRRCEFCSNPWDQGGGWGHALWDRGRVSPHPGWGCRWERDGRAVSETEVSAFERGTGRSGGEQPQMTRAQQVMAGGEVEADRSLDWDTVMGNSFSARRLSTWNSLPPFQGGQR